MSLERIDELRADHATVGLSPAERAEFEAALDQPLDDDSASLELAAAAVELAMLDEIEPMPESVASGLRRQAEHAASIQRRQLADVTPISAGRRSTAPSEPVAANEPSFLPWLVAAAAALIAVLGWFRTVEPVIETRIVEAPPIEQPTPEAERQVLLTSNSDALQLPWTATEDPASEGATGDLVWSNTEQRGFMRFDGLEPNDPSVTRYQLWIFDGTRDDRYPIDGGLFDVPASGEVVVPIDARLEVSKPVLFAVTVEEPDGVVVSTRERIVLVAQSST